MLKKLIVSFCLVLATLITVKAQSVTYYPWSSVLSVATNPNKTFWTDFRFQTNSYFSSLSTEIAPTINLNKNYKVRYYLGAGVKINFLKVVTDNKATLLDGYFLTSGVRVAPFENAKGVQISFEISPYAADDFESGLFRTRLGLGYNFDWRK